MDKSSNLNMNHMIDSISSSLIIIFMKIFFHQSHYYGHRFSDFSLSNLIGLLLSIKIDRSHLDAHSTLTVDQLSLTSTTKAHWDTYLCINQTLAVILWAVVQSQIKKLITQLQHRDNHWWINRNLNDLSYGHAQY